MEYAHTYHIASNYHGQIFLVNYTEITKNFAMKISLQHP